MVEWILDNLNNYDDNKKDKIDEYISISNSNAAALEETIMKIDSGSLEKILQNLTISQIIKSLIGASDNLRDFVLSNIKGQATRLLIIDELKNAEIQNEKIIEAQEGVLKVVLRLRECGEI